MEGEAQVLTERRAASSGVRGRRRPGGKHEGDEISPWIKDEVIQRSERGKEDTLAVTSLP